MHPTLLINRSASQGAQKWFDSLAEQPMSHYLRSVGMFALILVPKVVNSGLILWLICPIGPLSQIGWNVRTDLDTGHLRNRLC